MDFTKAMAVVRRLISATGPRIGLAGLCLAAASLPAARAEAPMRVVRGTAGLVAVPFVARNEASGPIACVAALAHWYSLDLGQAGPGGRIEATIWSDARTGELFLLNASADRMAVQAIACGPDGSAWTSGNHIAIDARAGAAPGPVSVACRPASAGVVACR